MIRSNLRSGRSSTGYVTVAYSGIEISYHSTDCLAVGSPIKCGSDRFEQQLMIQRFPQELDRALSHRLNPQPGAPIACNKDDRDAASLLFKLGLQFQTGHPRHLDFSYQTPDFTVQIVFEKFSCRSKAPRHQASRLN